MRHIFTKSLTKSAAIGLAIFSCQALALELNQPLPKVEIAQKGEVLLEGENIRYTAWESAQLTGKVRIVQHMAGKPAAKKINEPLIEGIKAAKFDQEKYQTTTIINASDAVWGTSALITGKAEKNKALYPWSSIVVDEKGQVRNAWKLEKDSSAIAVLNQSGEVLFFKDGALTPEEVKSVLELVKTHIN